MKKKNVFRNKTVIDKNNPTIGVRVVCVVEDKGMAMFYHYSALLPLSHFHN